jgi:hypothetical protein
MAQRKAFPLRLDPVIYDALQRWADAEFRSVNGQIEFLLRKALVECGRLESGRSRREDSATETNANED